MELTAGSSRIGIKIALLIGLVEVAAMVILFLTVNHSLSLILKDKAISDMSIMAKDRAKIVETYIEDCVDFLNGYCKATESREALLHPEDPECIQAARDHTALYAEGYNDIEGLYVAQWDTYVLAHINPDSVDKTFRDPESAKELEEMIKAEGKPFCTGIVLAPVTKKMVIPVYAPIYDKNKNALGFAGAAFYTDALENKLYSLTEGTNTNVDYSLINASNNIYIFDNHSELVGTECDDQNVLGAISKLKEGLSADDTYSYSADDRIFCCYYIPERDWLFLISDTTDDIFGVIDTVRARLILICLIITIAMVFICIVAVDRQMRPIKTIHAAIERLKANNYQKDPVIDEYSMREDEFGTIASAVQNLHMVLESQYELFLEMIEAQSVGTIVLSAENEDIVLINNMALQLFGINEGKREGLKIEDIRARFDAEENQHIKEQLDTIRNTNKDLVFEMQVNKSEVRKLTLLTHAKGVLLSNGDKIIIVSMTDISEQKKLEENLLILSETDFLTSICNRRSGEYRIEDNISQELFGMFCLFDVDKFKLVNDSFGHAAGDALLIGIAKTMQKTFRTSDILIRLGGDEFAIYATGIDNIDLGKRLLDRFMDNIITLDIPELQGHKISISLGAVIINSPSSFSEMYARADSLMYECKKKPGNSYVFYDV